MTPNYRVKCPYCGEVTNVNPNAPVCPKCKQTIAISQDACIYLYRQGSPVGIASGFGIYINGVPYGHIGNKELLCIPLPYGSYNIHCAVGMNRRCRDMLVPLTPENRVAYTKVYMKMGFWTNSFVIEPIDPKLLEL